MKIKFFLILLTLNFNLIAQNGNKEFDLNEIFASSKFAVKNLRQAKWLHNENKLSFLEYDPQTREQKIVVYNPANKSKFELLSSSDLIIDESSSKLTISYYEISPTKDKVLLTGILPARRIKSGGEIFLYDLKEKKLKKLPIDGSSINVKFSPDGKLIGYVLNHNLYVYELASNKIKQITEDGNDNILNGHFDWAYEEEFSIIDGWIFSPNCNYIAFWRIDQTDVPQIQIQQYDSLYFNYIKMKYPKTGGNISQVKIGIANLQTGEVKYISFEKDVYIPRIYWTTRENELAVVELNRLQNEMKIYLYDAQKITSKLIYEEKDSVWIDIEDFQFLPLKDKKNIVLTSEKEGYNNIYFIDYDGKILKRITTNLWDVSSVVSINEEKKLIYFLTNAGNPIEQHLYSISFDGKRIKKVGNFEGYNFSSPSFDSKYFLITNSSSSNPPQVIIINDRGDIVDKLVNNDELSHKLSDYKFNPPIFNKFKTTDNTDIYYSMILPTSFDSSKKYPVLIYNYSGPGSQIVRNIWGGSQYLWHQMLAQKGYIIFSLDNRGTGGRGKKFKTIVYKNLGYYEINDIVEGCKYLSNLKFVDSSRIGIWGWSYGGYISALAMVKAPDIFKAAVSVAPVTDWKFYDAIYTERYMSLPELNQAGYESSSVINKVNNLIGRLLLIHGDADDNVHIQNTFVLVRELIASGKRFELMIYPGKDHSIAGGNSRLHLFELITSFILKNL